MKLRYYISLIIASITVQSCSHMITFQESNYSNPDSPYPATSTRFSYYADGRSLPDNLNMIGNRIFNNVKSDNHYKTHLQSAQDYEDQNGSDKKLREEYIGYLSDVSKLTNSSSSNHQSMVSQANSLIEGLTKFQEDKQKNNFNSYWKRIFQLSHRGIIQHHMNADLDYRNLNNKDKELVYGYILKQDEKKCEELANDVSLSELSVLSGTLSSIRSVKNKHSNLLNEEIKKEKERQYALERERQAKQQRERQIAEEKAREEARQREEMRRQDLSWLRGTWLSISDAWTAMSGGPQQYQISIGSTITIQYLYNNRWRTVCSNVGYVIRDESIILNNGDVIKFSYRGGKLSYRDYVLRKTW